MRRQLASAVVAGCASAATAGVAVETYGTAAPPRTVIGQWLVTVPPSPDLYLDITYLPDGLGAGFWFSSPVNVRRVGEGWGSWSHGYTGNVYYSNGAKSLTIFPFYDTIFQFYVQPASIGVASISVTGVGPYGTSSVSAAQQVDGDGGAAGWAFYMTDYTWVESVTITADVDFAVGEMAYWFVPAPGGLGVLVVTGLLVRRRACPMKRA